MIYFKSPGRDNVDKTLTLAKERALQLGIKNVIVASTRGFTAGKALEAFNDTDITLTVVGIDRGRFPVDLLGRLEEKAHSVCFSREVSYNYPELVKSAYRRFCEGVKVAVEIPMIAADSDLIATYEDVISIGKWDTALVLKPAKSRNFAALRIKELICKPR